MLKLDELYTVKDAALFLGISRQRIQELIKDERLPAHVIYGRDERGKHTDEVYFYLIPEASVFKYRQHQEDYRNKSKVK